jgi:hypothetical protein
LLAAELEDRERHSIDRRIKEVRLPRVKTLDDFDFREAPTVLPSQLSELAAGAYLERAEANRSSSVTRAPAKLIIGLHEVDFRPPMQVAACGVRTNVLVATRAESVLGYSRPDARLPRLRWPEPGECRHLHVL